MSVASGAFLYLFLPVCFLTHTLIRDTRGRNIILLCASLLFYAWGEPVFVIGLAASVLFNHFMARFFDGTFLTERKTLKKVLFVLAVLIDLAPLMLYKYAAFAVELVNGLFPAFDAGSPELPLPLGISFYTFRVISYIADVYRGKAKAQKNLIKTAVCLSFFPCITAGPIVCYADMEAALSDRTVTWEGCSHGLNRLAGGLVKKVFLSAVFATAADRAFSANGALTAGAAWLGAAAYLGQLYFDFSGYCDVAVGLGALFGFTLPENFNYPYAARSLRDFWRRWHITLSVWFKEYVYIPMGGSRKGKVRTCFNRITVFLLTGLWHGAGIPYLVWGLYHGILTAAEDLLAPLFKRFRFTDGAVWRVLSHVYVLFTATVGFVIFRAPTLTDAAMMFRAMFSVAAPAGALAVRTMLTPLLAVAFVIGIVLSIPAVTRHFERTDGRARPWLTCAWGLVLLVLAMLAVAGASYTPFIYQRF